MRATRLVLSMLPLLALSLACGGAPTYVNATPPAEQERPATGRDRFMAGLVADEPEGTRTIIRTTCSGSCWEELCEERLSDGARRCLQARMVSGGGGGSYTGSAGGPVHVRGYYRRDGTYVRSHTRSRPRR